MKTRMIVVSVALVCVSLLAVGCKRETPPPMPMYTAQQYYDMGLQAFTAENFVQATQYFESAVSLSPSMADAHYYLGLCYMKQNMLRRAEDSLVTALRYNPGLVRAREALGILYYTKGDYFQAKRELEQARVMYSTNAQVYYYLGSIYMSEGNCPTALGLFTRAVELDPSSIPARQALDDAKRRCGKGVSKPAPQPRIEKSFKGGGKALDPSEF
ncbi:MAG: tetratricopeptide repeat protein [Desulfovibrio sp.]|nr:tetratricopeptide repeat protein [Desulfovibrio sp.]